jgi:DegV family protein with EDD domain
MSRVALCTDSSALLPEGGAEALDVVRVPVGIAIDGEAYEPAGVDDFYARVSRGAEATTSQPSPGEFLDAYRALAESGVDEVLSIHLDARVSGTVASAQLAAREVDISITVVDSGTVSFGVGVCVQAAAAALARGLSASAAAAAARRLGSRLGNVFVAADAPAGRVGGARESAWTVLQLVDGVTVPVLRCDGAGGATETMAAKVLDLAGPVQLAVGHASRAVEPWADALAELVAGGERVVGVERYRVSAAVGAHTGPLSFGAFWWPAE